MYLALAEGGYLVDASWLEDMATSLNTSWSSKGTVFTPALETRYPAPVPADFRDVSIQWEPHFSRRTVFSGYRFISFKETFVSFEHALVIHIVPNLRKNLPTG